MRITSRVLTLTFIIIFSGIFIFVKLKTNKQCTGCSNHKIDITKMLQNGDQLHDLMIGDRFGQIFNMDDYKNKPILFSFVTDNIQNIKIYDDSIKSYLGKYIKDGLIPIYINSSHDIDRHEMQNLSNPRIFFDDDSLNFSKAFKIHKHSSSIILDKNHRVVLSSLGALLPKNLLKILEYKEKEIFGS